MPIVDGWASMVLIRELEQKHPMPSRAVQTCGRTPIFAISGMLRRGDEQQYIDASFDGWMPKPVDLKRLATCLSGALDIGLRSLGIYDSTRFELGGWFPAENQLSSFSPSIAPQEDKGPSPLSPRPERGKDRCPRFLSAHPESPGEETALDQLVAAQPEQQAIDQVSEGNDALTGPKLHPDPVSESGVHNADTAREQEEGTASPTTPKAPAIMSPWRDD